MASRLVEILASEKLVAPEVLEKQAQLAHDIALVERLLQAREINEEDVLFTLSRHLRIPAIPRERLLHLGVGSELRRRIPRSLARRFLLFPLDYNGAQKTLSVAMVDPSDDSARTILHRTTGAHEIRAYVAPFSAVLAAIDAAYGAGGSAVAASLPQSLTEDSEEQRDPAEITQVELIPGKVSVDPNMLREIAEISPDLVEESLRARSPRGRIEQFDESNAAIRAVGTGPSVSSSRARAHGEDSRATVIRAARPASVHDLTRKKEVEHTVVSPATAIFDLPGAAAGDPEPASGRDDVRDESFARHPVRTTEFERDQTVVPRSVTQTVIDDSADDVQLEARATPTLDHFAQQDTARQSLTEEDLVDDDELQMAAVMTAVGVLSAMMGDQIELTTTTSI
jgi:hypothetical protein